MRISFTKKNLLLTVAIILGTITTTTAQNPEPVEMECSHIWQKNTLAACIGDRGMYVGDLNGNGRDEMILGNHRIWNVLEYIPAYQSYEVIWGSNEYDELHTLAVADADNDGINEVLIFYSNHDIDLYDLTTRELKATYEIDVYGWYWGENVIVADVDNNGLNELIVIHSDGMTFFRITNGICTKLFEMNQDASDARCGDIDGDGLNELVLNNGTVYRIENGVPELVWTFLPLSDYFGLIELADIDNDNLPEIISIYDGFKVFDGDTQEIKWQIPGVWAEALTVDNIDNTGLPEIIYIEDQWGEVVCLESNDGSERWRVENPGHGATNIKVCDPDGDGNKEFVFGEGCTSSAPDHLYVFQIPDLTQEYVSLFDHGQYRIIRVADVDADGSNELITLSRGSETYGSGIISVYNAENRQLKWRSNDSLIPIQNFSLMVAMEIADVDNDGDPEYVIASGDGYSPAISVINARTHHVDTVKVWEVFGASQPFYDLAIADLNNDGILEYIAVSEDSLSIINSQTLQKTRNITDASVYDFTSPVTGNIDDDVHIELVYIKQHVFVMDGVTEETWVLETGDRFINCFLYDYDRDSVADIIASTYDGDIYSINGITHQPTLIANIGEAVWDMHMADITGDSAPEIIYTFGNTLYVLYPDGSVIYTVINEQAIYSNMVTEITDYNNDGREEIFIGTTFYVQELDAGCYDYCNNLFAGMEVHNTSCYTSNGSAVVFPTGGTEPYSILWSNGDTTAAIDSLAAGTYRVIVTDSLACTYSLEFAIDVIEFMIDTVLTTPDILTTVECEGSAVLSTTNGTPPYAIFMDGQWTNLADSAVTGLCEGDYPIMLQDANGCTASTTVNIYSVVGLPEKDASLVFNIYPNPASGSAWLQTGLTPKAGTYVIISTPLGVPLKRIEINGQRTQLDVSHLPKGIYLVTLSNTNGLSTRKLMVD